MQAQLDPNWTLVITYPNDSLYNTANPYFEKLGIAFANLEAQTIYFDGAEVSESYFTKDHMLAVEAHEIGHMIASHQGEPYYSKRQEQEADWLGINLLIQNAKTKAANLLAERFSDSYKIQYTELSDSERLEELLEDYLTDK
jgi:HD superfamily phosphohydrolase